MKISIITVVLNGEKTIGRAIESVVSQKNIDLEYILIDGGSDDKTLEIVAAYKDQITHLVSEKDTGIYDAMNKGLRLATGDIIGILNADDIYANGEVLSSVQSYFLSLDLDALYGDLEYFDSDQPLRAFRTYRSSGFSAGKLSQGLMPAHPTLFLHRKVYEEYGLFNTTYKIAGDFEFIARIFRRQKLTTLYVPKIMVRMQSGGISTAGFKSTQLLLRENLRACKENGIYTNYLLLLSRYPRKLLEYFM